MSQLDMGRLWLRRSGVRDSDIPSDAIRLAGVLLGQVKMSSGPGYQSVGDFPGILGNVASRLVLEHYNALPAALKVIASKRMATDFRALSLVRLGEYPQLQKVGPSGEFKYGPILESTESYRVETFGAITAINRQAIVNDDLGVFSKWPQVAAQSATGLEASTMVALLTANAGLGSTMSDGLTLFHATHGNLASAGGQIGDLTLSAGRLAMRRQTGVDRVTLIDVNPKFLVVPAALETTAQKYLAALQPAQASNVNVFSNSLTLVVEPRLDAISTTRWYLAADPGMAQGLEYAFLTGAEGPQVETRLGWEVDGMEMKVRLDFGAGVVNWRGLYMNPGA